MREGFIVDEEEDEEDGEARPAVKRKREHRDREEEERLDDDDLDLIGEQYGAPVKAKPQVSQRTDAGLRKLTMSSPSSNA